MAIAEYSSGTWTASSVAAGFEDVVTLPGPGTYVLYMSGANLTAADDVDVRGLITATGLAGLVMTSFYGGQSLIFLDGSYSTGVYDSLPIVVASGQSVDISADQVAGASVQSVNWVANRIT